MQSERTREFKFRYLVSTVYFFHSPLTIFNTLISGHINLLAAQGGVVREGKPTFGFDDTCVTGMLAKECIEGSMQSLSSLLPRDALCVETFGLSVTYRKQDINKLAEKV